jgi:hypothetical protein
MKQPRYNWKNFTPFYLLEWIIGEGIWGIIVGQYLIQSTKSSLGISLEEKHVFSTALCD